MDNSTVVSVVEGVGILAVAWVAVVWNRTGVGPLDQVSRSVDWARAVAFVVGRIWSGVGGVKWVVTKDWEWAVAKAKRER